MSPQFNLKSEKSINSISLFLTIMIHIFLLITILPLIKLNFTPNKILTPLPLAVRIHLVSPPKIAEPKKAIKPVATISTTPLITTKKTTTLKDLPKVKNISFIAENKKDNKEKTFTKSAITQKKPQKNEVLKDIPKNSTDKTNSIGIIAKEEKPGVNINADVRLPGDRDYAQIIGIVKPIYPKTALNNEWSGTVKARVLVDINGEPKNISLIKSSGYALLDESFTRTLASKKFRPKIVAGKPIEDQIELEYTFNLN